MKNRKYKKGFSSLMVFMMGLTVVLMVQSIMTFNLASFNLVRGVDTLRQQWSERHAFEQVLKEVLLTQFGVSGATSGKSFNKPSIGQDFVTKLYPLIQNANGVSYGFTPNQLPGTSATRADFMAEFSANFFTESGSPFLTSAGATMFPAPTRMSNMVVNHLPGMNQSTAVLNALRGVGQSNLIFLMSGPFVEMTHPLGAGWPWLNPDNLVTDPVSGPWYPFPAFTRFVNYVNSYGSQVDDTMQQVVYAPRYRVFSVPLTNFNLIPYGLPATVMDGTGVPSGPPSVILNSGVLPLLVTTNSPLSDDAAFSDLYSAPAPGAPQVLPYRYRAQVSAAWDSFEYIFTPGAQGYLDVLGNYQLGGAFPEHKFSFSDLAAEAPTGFSYDVPSTTVTINLTALEVPVASGSGSGGPNGTPNWTGVSRSAIYYVTDMTSMGALTNNVVIQGDGLASTHDRPLILVIRNQSLISGGNRTNVRFVSTNSRPVLVYLVGCDVSFDAGVSYSGAIFTDMNCVWRSSPVIYGTFGFYHGMDIHQTSVNSDPYLKFTFADVSPRFTLVEVKVDRK